VRKYVKKSLLLTDMADAAERRMLAGCNVWWWNVAWIACRSATGRNRKTRGQYHLHSKSTF